MEYLERYVGQPPTDDGLFKNIESRQYPAYTTSVCSEFDLDETFVETIIVWSDYGVSVSTGLADPAHFFARQDVREDPVQAHTSLCESRKALDGHDYWQRGDRPVRGNLWLSEGVLNSYE